MDWKTILVDIIIPIGTCIAGFFGGKAYEKKKITKNKASIKGNGNTVNQNNEVNIKG